MSVASLFAMHRISFCTNDFLKKQLASKVHLSAVVLREQAGKQTRDILYPNLCGKDIDSQLPNITAMRNSKYKVPYYPVTDDTFTLVMVTHERDELLRKALKRYGQVDAIDSIIIYWNNPGRKPPNFRAEMTFRMPLVIKEVELKSLGERYTALEETRTKGNHTYAVL